MAKGQRPLRKAPPPASVARDIIQHIVHHEFDALGYGADPLSWPRHLSTKTGISLGTARNLLGASNGPPRRVTDRVLTAVARHFSGLPDYAGLTGTHIGNARDLASFLAATSGQLQEQSIALRIRRRSTFDEIANDVIGTYVAYHHSFESRSPDLRLAREVVCIERHGAHLTFTMSFKNGANDAGQRVRFFQGEAVPLGKSTMCIGTATPFNNPQHNSWPTDHDRGRALFFRRNIDPIVNDLAKFGILVTTRHDGGFEPCAACTILVKVQAPIRDLDAFFQRVTVVRPYDDIVQGDFAGLSEPDPAVPGRSQLEALFSLLGNVPRMQSHDKVLKLGHDRFSTVMPDIIRTVSQRSETAAPFKSNWQQCTNLAEPL